MLAMADQKGNIEHRRDSKELAKASWLHSIQYWSDGAGKNLLCSFARPQAYLKFLG
jgi:hypothetical protein